jgi:DNA-binding CsgD family transcriptional regulator
MLRIVGAKMQAEAPDRGRIANMLDGQDAVSVGMLALDRAGGLLYCNRNGQALLKSARVVHLCNGVVYCTEVSCRPAFNVALAYTADTGQPAHLLLSDSAHGTQRYSVSFSQLLKSDAHAIAGAQAGVLCLIAPLDQRRTATVHQLMQLFGLSAAEARLARALASGDTLESYAQANALKMPTVKSQLRAVFAKTGTERQAALVRLIMAIPAVRNPG